MCRPTDAADVFPPVSKGKLWLAGPIVRPSEVLEIMFPFADQCREISRRSLLCSDWVSASFPPLQFLGVLTKIFH